LSGWSELRRVLPATADVGEAGRLTIGGCDVEELVRAHGTPLFVMDEEDFRSRLSAYRDAFGGENVHYAAKAFLTSTLAPVLSEEGVGLDCASGGELYTALQGGFDPRRIVLHGNNKSDEELELAVDSAVYRVVIDSVHELEQLERIAASREVAVGALLRIAPGIEAHTHDYLKTAIEDTKFGVQLGEGARRAIDLAARAPHVELEGIHCHIGSQVFDLFPFEEAARVLVAFLAEMRRATGLELPELDLGGGLGIAYLPSDEPSAVSELAKSVLGAVEAAAREHDTPVPVVKVEPGRSVVGPSMVTLYRAGTIKEVPGIRTYLAVDGGMSDNIRPALYGAPYTFLSATRPQAPHDRTYAIAGKLCESGDLLSKDARLPDVQPGELVAVAATGAYCYAMSSNYNRLPRPGVVAVRDGAVRVLARRETWDDLVRLER